jgi:hypothetical protein
MLGVRRCSSSSGLWQRRTSYLNRNVDVMALCERSKASLDRTFVCGVRQGKPDVSGRLRQSTAKQ